MAQIIYPDGTRRDVLPKGKTYSLEELQHIVGGYIEIAPTTDGGLLVMDEEGRLKGKPFNGTATKLYLHNNNGRNFIVGTVLYVPSTETYMIN